MVLLKRFELPTLALRKPCSTPELQQRTDPDGCLHVFYIACKGPRHNSHKRLWLSCGLMMALLAARRESA